MPSVNHWFFKRRGLALGIVTSGSSVGGVIWPIAIDHLIIKVVNISSKFRASSTDILSARLWLGPSSLRLHLPGPDRRGGFDGTRSFTTQNRIRILRVQLVSVTGLYLFLVSSCIPTSNWK